MHSGVHRNIWAPARDGGTIIPPPGAAPESIYPSNGIVSVYSNTPHIARAHRWQ